MEGRPLPPWAGELKEGQFISYDPTYTVGKYFHLYEKALFPSSEVGDMTYYYYDPTKHGYPKDREYPLLVFMHGASNALEGDICINYSGAESYASPEYQKTMGGAYVLIPLANEKRAEDGSLLGGWSESYLNPVMSLIQKFEDEHDTNKKLKFVFGNSSGANFCQQLVERNPSCFTGCIPIGSGYVPSDEALDIFDENNVHLFFAFCRHDEFHKFDEKIAPHMKRFQAMKHCFLYLPEWAYNGDGGIASINFGIEMGQHCLINMMQANLILDDGTILDDRLPEGVTGWIRDVCNE